MAIAKAFFMFGGHCIKTLNVRWLRAQLGLVGQEPLLFQGAIASNIAYGHPEATRQQIIEAARAAAAAVRSRTPAR